MEVDEVPFTELLSTIVDNRGRTCPTAENGLPLIATNCVRNELLYPAFEKVRYVSEETYDNWFRGHPIPGDLIFVCKGTPGRVCMTPDPVSFCIAQDMVAVRADPEKVYPKYLFALLRSSQVQAQIGNMHVGTLIPHFKKGDFDKLLLPVPTNKKEQETIGDAYFELSAKIELNRRMNATLEAMVRALFQSWFVDFDPVRAKLDGRQPIGMDQATAALFPDAFEHAADGTLIPKGWSRLSLMNAPIEIIDGDRGKNYPKQSDFMTDGHCLFLNAGNVTSDGFSLTDCKFITEEKDNSLRKGKLKRLDSVMTTRGTVGNVAYYNAGFPFDQVRINSGMVIFRARPDAISPIYLFRLLRSDSFEEQVGSLTTGSAQPQLPIRDINRIIITLPTIAVQLAFAKTVDVLDNKMAQVSTESRTLATLRDTLLPKLLSGELSVTNAEQQGGRAS